MPENLLNPELAAGILAGGQSRRMGQNKALIEIRGQPLIQRTVQLARLFTDEVFISSNQPRVYGFLALPVVADVFVEQGPLSGLHAVMLHTARPLLLLMASDLPRIHKDLIERLIEHSSGFDAVVPRTSDGRLHPLCAVYRRSCLDGLEDLLRRGIRKATELLELPSLTVHILEGQEGNFRDADLLNLNYPDDLPA